MRNLKKIVSFTLILLLCGNVFAQIDHKKILLSNVWSDNCNQKQGFILFVEDTKNIIKKYYDSNGSENTSWAITTVESLEFQPLAVQLIYEDGKKLGGEVLIFKSDLTGFRVHNRYLGNEWIISNYKFEGTGLDSPEIKKCLPTSPVGMLASKTTSQQVNIPSERKTRFDKQVFLKLISESNDVMTKFCSGKPKNYLTVFERLGQSLEVNPDSINLKRVGLITDGHSGELYFRCVGIYYSPKGAHECEVQFDEKGSIAKACSKAGDMTYTEKLIYSFIFMAEFNNPVEPYDQNGNPTGSKEWGEGNRYRIRIK
jgi:hypothetical protein